MGTGVQEQLEGSTWANPAQRREQLIQLLAGSPNASVAYIIIMLQHEPQR